MTTKARATIEDLYRVPGKAEILIQVPERLGGKVIEAKGLTKGYGDKLLFENLSFTLPPGPSWISTVWATHSSISSPSVAWSKMSQIFTS